LGILADQLWQPIAQTIFGDALARAGFERSLPCKIWFVSGQADNTRARIPREDPSDRPESRIRRQVQIHQRYIGKVLQEQVHRFPGRGRGAYKLHVRLHADKEGEPFTHQRIVVHGKDTNSI
jgi:hypothetical protein